MKGIKYEWFCGTQHTSSYNMVIILSYFWIKNDFSQSEILMVYCQNFVFPSSFPVFIDVSNLILDSIPNYVLCCCGGLLFNGCHPHWIHHHHWRKVNTYTQHLSLRIWSEFRLWTKDNGEGLLSQCGSAFVLHLWWKHSTSAVAFGVRRYRFDRIPFLVKSPTKVCLKGNLYVVGLAIHTPNGEAIWERFAIWRLRA